MSLPTEQRETELVDRIVLELERYYSEYLGSQFDGGFGYSPDPADPSCVYLRKTNQLRSDTKRILLRIFEVLRPSEVGNFPDNINPDLIIGVPKLSTMSRNLLRLKGYSYIDLNGGFFFTQGDNLKILVDKNLEYRRGKDEPGLIHRPVPGVSTGRATLYRSLLATGKNVWGVRELAEVCGLSPGGVSNYLEELMNTGWVERDGRSEFRLADPSALLDYWAGMARRLRLDIRGYAVLPSRYDELREKVKAVVARNKDVYHTLWSGAEFYGHYMEQPAIALYCDNPDVIKTEFSSESSSKMKYAQFGPLTLGISQDLIIGTSKNGPLYLIRSPYKTIGVGAVERNGERAVCWQQVYVDLAEAPLRGKSIAQMLREEMER